MTTTAPPTWAMSHAQHLDGLRRLIESAVEEEHGRPMWALPALLAVIPDQQRQLCLADLRLADYGGGDSDQRLADAIEHTVKVYDEAMTAAYAPPLSDDEVHDCHTEVTPAMLARAELHPLGDPRRCDVDARIDELVALLNDGPDLFGAAANYATAAALRGEPARYSPAEAWDLARVEDAQRTRARRVERTWRGEITPERIEHDHAEALRLNAALDSRNALWAREQARAGLPQRVPGASLAANPPRDVDEPGTEAAA